MYSMYEIKKNGQEEGEELMLMLYNGHLPYRIYKINMEAVFISK